MKTGLLTETERFEMCRHFVTVSVDLLKYVLNRDLHVSY